MTDKLGHRKIESQHPMRIGVDLACWNNHRGYGRYTRNLLRALLERDRQHTYVGLADSGTIAQGTFPRGLQVVAVPQSEPPAWAAAAHRRRKLVDVWRMSRAVYCFGFDLMFFPTSYTYFPIFGRTRCVVVIHDAIAERWPSLIFPDLVGRLAWTLKSRLACWQAHRVVTVSHAAAQAIQEYLPVPYDRLRVIHEAPDPVFGDRDAGDDGNDSMNGARCRVLQRYAIPEHSPLLLYVGGFSPHKNVAALLAAVAQLLGSAPADVGWGDAAVGGAAPVHVVLVGETTKEVFNSCYAALREQVHRLRLEQHVTFTGFVPDTDLASLYHAATCLVLPSYDEGFGLPVAEAMACGTPVVASRVGAIEELVGDAGLLFDPDRTEALVAALRRVISEPALRSELRGRGLRRAAELSWDRAAAGLLDVFSELAPLPHQLHGRRAGRAQQRV